MSNQKTFLCQLIFFLLFTNLVRSQWIKVPFPSDEFLYKVRFVSQQTGWILGASHVYKTNDGGSTWSVRDSVWGYGGGGFHAINDTTVIYFDNARGIRKTNNDGKNWLTTVVGKYFIVNFKFITPNLGFACGGGINSNDSGVVFRTSDGGEDWELISKMNIGKNNSDFESVAFLDSLHGWAVTYGAKIYYSANGGFNWIFQDSIINNIYPQPLRDIQFTTKDSGWVVGGIGGNSSIAKTINGGKTWNSIISPEVTACSIREISMLNSQTGWFAASYNGPAYVAKTTDGGSSWINQTPPEVFFGFQSISMIDGSHGFVVGDRGNVYKTTNGGVTSSVVNNSINNIIKFSLDQNYPNPFNPSTVLRYQIPVISYIKLKVYNALGKEIAILVNEEKRTGNYEVEFDGKDLSSGIYFYSITVEARDGSKSFREAKKMILLK